MAQIINIRRDVQDKFYRYKMPKLISKIEGKGNGIKTVIVNMSDIAKSLSRPPMYPTKYFGCELGSQTKGDASTDRYIVNGAHDAEKLQTLLDGFIGKFVLCASCKNPETDIIVAKDETMTKSCKACGAVLPVDLTHKLCTYILKNPPNPVKGKKDKKSKKDKGQSDSVEALGSENALATDFDANGEPMPQQDTADGDDEVTRRIAQEAAQLPEIGRSKGNEDEDDDDDWAVDTSAAAVAARIKELAVQGAVAKLMDDDDPLEQFGTFVQENPNADDQIKAKALELDIRRDKAATILAQTLFTPATILKDIPSRAELLTHFISTEKEQKGFLGGLERLIGLSFPKDLISKTPLILKAAYDAEIIDEEVMLAWGDKVSKKYVDRKVSKEIHEKAEPFLKWLQEAEEEESSGEEEDDE